MRRLVSIALFVSGVSGGLLLAPGPERVRKVAQAAPLPPPDGLSCPGGPESPLKVELVPAEIASDGRGESLRARLRLTSRFERAASVRHAVELVDDRGRAVRAPVVAAPGRLEAGMERDIEVRVPAGLADGYYRLRVTAVASDGKQDAADVVEEFALVEGGRITPVDIEDYLANSAANVGVQK